MKKIKQAVILAILLIIIGLGINQYALADNNELNVNDFISKKAFSIDFQRWLELSESEKETVILPPIYNDLYTTVSVTNPIYRVNMLGASLNSSFDLREVIKDNLVIRNQENTSLCWAFAGLSSLETNLALKNYNSGNALKIYDYSERHANYSLTRMFSGGAVNKYRI